MQTTPLSIIADENIVGLQVFEGFAQVRRVSGRNIDPDILRHADALLVRSVTRVDRSLIEGSPVKFIASATSGTDHVDLDYLKQQGIHFAYAPGSNANSVVEYVIAALASLSQSRSFDWREKNFGIIGAGNIGTLLADTLSRLKISFIMHDPLLDDAYAYAEYLRPLQEVLQQDVVSLHVPLTRDGLHPTHHMLDGKALKAIRPETIVVNTARGGVIDNQALDAVLSLADAPVCVLDVWEGEPQIHLPLLGKVALATPHVAGYSMTGKERGTAQLFKQLVSYFHLDNVPDYPESPHGQVLNIKAGGSELEQINQAILCACEIERDHRAMQKMLHADSPAELFDQLRKQYPSRQEFSDYQLDHADLNPAATKVLRQLGFS